MGAQVQQSRQNGARTNHVCRQQTPQTALTAASIGHLPGAAKVNILQEISPG